MKNVYSIHDLVMKRPASAFSHRWMDATPVGNGKTGVLLYGGVTAEHLVINRSDLWFGGSDAPVPDVSYCLEKMRQMQSEGDYKNAQYVMYNELIKKGYGTTLADMRVLGRVKIVFSSNGIYSNYRRILHMDTAEAEVTYKIDDAFYKRRYFASRKRDITVVEIISGQKADFRLDSGFYETKEGEREETARKSDAENAAYSTNNGCYIYSSCNEGKFFGIACRTLSDGEVCCNKDGISVTGSTKTLILVKAFSEEENRQAAENSAIKCLLDCPEDYDALFAESLPLYQKYYNSANICLYSGEMHTNEYLLENAKETELGLELFEKLWRFGRYFFISASAPDGLPCPLYGVWPSGYERMFSHHVANENVQSIYWHTDVGGLSELVLPLINYYYGKMDTLKENAKNLYGCNGIFVGTYTTPKNAAVAWYVPVILHFVGAAGWLSSHFYKYYKYSGDEVTFRQKILPFMLAAAEFYEDYYYTGKDGKLVLYPAVSPENSPLEFYSKTDPHSMTVVKNPTIEIAILKELLTNLLEVAYDNPALEEKAKKWEQMLSIMPDYKVNAHGAVAEWLDDTVSDYYNHRHLSHLYPVFPASELEDTGDTSLKAAFARAVDLRGFGSFVGWSMPHMSAIYSRLGDAQMAYKAMNALPKVCLLENFFTLGHDFRDMGITGFDCGNEFVLPVQFDALLSSVNALQEMLVFSSNKCLRLLPACPDKLSEGNAELCFMYGSIQFSWDLEQKLCSGKLTANRDCEFTFEFPFGKPQKLKLKKGEEYSF